MVALALGTLPKGSRVSPSSLHFLGSFCSLLLRQLILALQANVDGVYRQENLGPALILNHASANLLGELEKMR